MNRPERRNALSGEMLDGMARALDYAERAASVRCVVLTGAGGGFLRGRRRQRHGRRRWSAAVRRSMNASTRSVSRSATPQAESTDAEAGHRDAAGTCGGRGPVARARVRHARHGRQRRDHHGVRPRRIQRRLRRHVLPGAAGGQRQGARTLLSVRAARCGGVSAVGIANRVVPAADLERTTLEIARRIATGPPLRTAT